MNGQTAPSPRAAVRPLAVMQAYPRALKIALYGRSENFRIPLFKIAAGAHMERYRQSAPLATRNFDLRAAMLKSSPCGQGGSHTVAHSHSVGRPHGEMFSPWIARTVDRRPTLWATHTVGDPRAPDLAGTVGRRPALWVARTLARPHSRPHSAGGATVRATRSRVAAARSFSTLPVRSFSDSLLYSLRAQSL
jgi:hypothetical protein